MPAHAWEVDAAEEEGVVLYPGRTFEEILGDEQGRVRGIDLQRVASFHFDEDGRLHLEQFIGRGDGLQGGERIVLLEA